MLNKRKVSRHLKDFSRWGFWPVAILSLPITVPILWLAVRGYFWLVDSMARAVLQAVGGAH